MQLNLLEFCAVKQLNKHAILQAGHHACRRFASCACCPCSADPIKPSRQRSARSRFVISRTALQVAEFCEGHTECNASSGADGHLFYLRAMGSSVAVAAIAVRLLMFCISQEAHRLQLAYTIRRYTGDFLLMFQHAAYLDFSCCLVLPHERRHALPYCFQRGKQYLCLLDF